MAHECGCRHVSPDVREHPLTLVLPEQTVAEVVRRRPETLETMKEMGINHCCGAHLTLREAAATAGVSLEVLLAALNEARKAPA